MLQAENGCAKEDFRNVIVMHGTSGELREKKRVSQLRTSRILHRMIQKCRVSPPRNGFIKPIGVILTWTNRGISTDNAGGDE